MKRFLYVCVILLIILTVVSCKYNHQSLTPTPIPDVVSTIYPLSTSTKLEEAYPLDEYKTIDQTAFDAYEIAAAYARLNWNPSAVFFSIPNTAIMEMNLGYPQTGLGWFFMFKVPENTLEYYVYVDQGIVQGYTEAQPITTSDNEFELLALPQLEKLLDSDEVLNIFQENGGKDYLNSHPQAKIVMELYYHKDNVSPIWKLHDITIEGIDNDVVFAVEAFSGESTEY